MQNRFTLIAQKADSTSLKSNVLYANATQSHVNEHSAEMAQASGLEHIHVSSKNTQPHLEVGLDTTRTNADSQWNPVYKAFYRIPRCGNETICR